MGHNGQQILAVTVWLLSIYNVLASLFTQNYTNGLPLTAASILSINTAEVKDSLNLGLNRRITQLQPGINQIVAQVQYNLCLLQP